MPFTLDLHEYLVNVESITVSAVLSSQSLSVLRSEFVAPQSNSLVADLNTPLRQQVFNIPMAKAKAVVEPNSILDDLGWESVTFIQADSTPKRITV
jgi:hypothetical protein